MFRTAFCRENWTCLFAVNCSVSYTPSYTLLMAWSWTLNKAIISNTIAAVSSLSLSLADGGWGGGGRTSRESENYIDPVAWFRVWKARQVDTLCIHAATRRIPWTAGRLVAIAVIEWYPNNWPVISLRVQIDVSVLPMIACTSAAQVRVRNANRKCLRGCTCICWITRYC